MADMLTEEQQEEKEAASFELDEQGEIFDAEKYGAEGSSGKAEEKADEEKEETAGEEVEEYSKRVQQRIDTIVTQRNNAKESESLAIEMGRSALAENVALKERLRGMDSGYVGEAEERIKSQMEQARQSFRVAVEAEDVEGQLAANEMLSRLGRDEDRVLAAKRRMEVTKDQEQNAPQYPQQQQQYQPPTPQPSEKAIEWAANNKWFGSDKPMTDRAYQIDKKLIEMEGVDPRTDEYYIKLDRELSEAFPSFYGTDVGNGGSEEENQRLGRKSSRAVAPVGSSRRPVGGKLKVVKLNEREMAMARKFCPSTDHQALDDFIKSYAKEKAIIAARDEG